MHDLCRLAGGDMLAAGLAGDCYTGHQRGHDQLCHRFGIEHGKSAHGHNGGSRAGYDAADIATTSLQKLETFSALRSRCRASAAPGTFLAAMASVSYTHLRAHETA